MKNRLTNLLIWLLAVSLAALVCLGLWYMVTLEIM